MNTPERDPGRRSLPHHPPLERDNQSILIYVTVNVKSRRRLLAREDAIKAVLDAWNEGNHWLVGRYAIMPDHIHFFCAPVVRTTTLKQWMQFWQSTATRHWPRDNENQSGRRISSIDNCVPAKATVRNGITCGRIR